MRDKLIDLVNEFKELDFCIPPDWWVEHLADHLLANGVIVPPYKPMPLIDEGDRVLCPICEKDLMGCYIGNDNHPNVVTCYECGAWIDNTKAIDREEAWKLLKGGE